MLFFLKTYFCFLKNVIITFVKKKYYLGIDVGGTKISGALISAQGAIIIRKKIPSPKNAKSKDIVNTIRSLIKELLSTSSFKKISLSGIGIGIPGVVDINKRKVIQTPNINLSNVALASLIKKRFKTKVLLENDVNLGTLGEKTFGVAKHAHNVIGLFPGTGIGGGIIIDDKLISGAHGAAGEIGHMAMDIHGPLCGCGHHGCLEALASRWAIERDIRQAIRQHKKTILKKLTKNKLNTIKSGILKEALKKKDPLTRKIMSEKSEILGLACINLRRLFDPEMIVLGGGLIEACGGFMLPIIRKTMASDRFFKKLKPCHIVSSKLGDDAVLLGAVALFR
jgi:glucokinase